VPLIIILRRAELELIDAMQWYEEQQQGLSSIFSKAVENGFNIIALNPLIYPEKYNRKFRFATVRKFPYLIVYWFEERTDTVYITSVFHTKRNPEPFI
jgi:plasmid stabilization system protein ParE